LSILDVGGFYEDNGKPTLPIKRFLPNDDVAVLDVVECDLPGYIRGDGAALDFDDAHFDLVISADTLEHIPQPRRAAFWRELLRVARHGVILLAPFGTREVEAAETLLYEYIKVELHAEHQQLKEHREYVLPRLNDWLQFLQQEGIRAQSYPTGYLHAWLGMMLMKHVLLRIDPGPEAQHLVDSYYNQSFFTTERRNPAYRHLIVAEKTAGLVDAVDAALAPTIIQDEDDASAGWSVSLLPTMLTITQRQLWATQQQVEATQHTQRQETHQYIHQINLHLQQISVLERVIADQQVMLNQLQQQLGQLHAQVGMAQDQSERYIAAIRDLTERSQWLDGQNIELRRQVTAMQNGRIMRLLSLVGGRK
jgi:SAM-dependent methyltransferase